jgi:hypothetical protein
MAEVLGIAASIVGLLHVCRKVNDVASQISGGADIGNKVRSEMKTMSILFRRIQDVISGFDQDREKNIDDVRAGETADDLVVILTGCVTSFTKLDF